MNTSTMRARAGSRYGFWAGLLVGLAGLLGAPVEADARGMAQFEQPTRSVKRAVADGERGEAVRYTRPSPKVRTHGNLDGRFKRAQKAEKQAAREAAPAGPPPLQVRDAIKHDIRVRQIEMLKALIRKTPNTDPEYADLVFRLASLYLDEKMYFEHRAGQLYEPIFQAENAESAGVKPPAAKSPTTSKPSGGSKPRPKSKSKRAPKSKPR